MMTDMTGVTDMTDMTERNHSAARAETAWIETVWEDECVIVLNKPSGLPSVPGLGDLATNSLAQRVQARCADALVVHRLDMATSGLLLMAKGIRWQREFSRMFSERTIKKRYEAVVAGQVEEDEGSMAQPLAADWPRRPRQRVDPVTGKASLTHYRVLVRNTVADHSRLALEPVTGRTHQLRVHLLALGHPILGDPLYGDSAVASRAERLLLHARSLNFVHPATGEAMNLESSVPF